MGCSGCGNNGPTPNVGSLDSGAIVLEYIGDRTAAVSYTANGQQYLAGKDRVHDYVWARPGDVNTLVETGHFRVAARWEPTTAIIIPTRGRVAKLTGCLNSLVQTAPSVKVVLVMDDDDAGTIDLASSYEKRMPIDAIVVEPGLTAGEKWNIGARSVNANTLIFAADDLIFHEGWIEETTKALRAFPDGSALVGFDELADSPHPLHYAVTRKLLDEVNGGELAVPHYRSWFMDVELCEKARAHGRYLPRSKAIVEHRHPQHGTAPIDDTHRAGFLANQHRDRWIYEQRKRASFPTDWIDDNVPARNWLVGFMPPEVDNTEQILNERMGIETIVDAEPVVVSDALMKDMAKKVVKARGKKRAEKAVPA